MLISPYFVSYYQSKTFKHRLYELMKHLSDLHIETVQVGNEVLELTPQEIMQINEEIYDKDPTRSIKTFIPYQSEYLAIPDEFVTDNLNEGILETVLDFIVGKPVPGIEVGKGVIGYYLELLTDPKHKSLVHYLIHPQTTEEIIYPNFSLLLFQHPSKDGDMLIKLHVSGKRYEIDSGNYKSMIDKQPELKDTQYTKILSRIFECLSLEDVPFVVKRAGMVVQINETNPIFHHQLYPTIDLKYKAWIGEDIGLMAYDNNRGLYKELSEYHVVLGNIHGYYVGIAMTKKMNKGGHYKLVVAVGVEQDGAIDETWIDDLMKFNPTMVKMDHTLPELITSQVVGLIAKRFNFNIDQERLKEAKAIADALVEELQEQFNP